MSSSLKGGLISTRDNYIANQQDKKSYRSLLSIDLHKNIATTKCNTISHNIILAAIILNISKKNIQNYWTSIPIEI